MKSNKIKVLLGTFAMLVMMFCMSIAAVAATTTEKPGKVTGIQQTKATEQSATIAWDAQPMQNCFYDVELSTNGVDYYKQNEYNSRDTDWYFSGLSAGKTYYVRVRAYTYDYSNPKNYADAYSDVFKMVTVPTEVKNLKQVGATTNSVTLQWNAVSGATSYYVYRQVGNTSTKVAEVKTNKATIGNLNPSLDYTLKVYAVRKDGSFVAADIEPYPTARINYYDLKLIPAKVNAKKITIPYYWQNLNEIKLDWAKTRYTDGYQVQVLKYNGKKAVFSTTATSNYTYAKKLKSNQYYKVRVRGYSLINGAKKYGAWSDYKYFSYQPNVTVKQVRTTKTAQVKWKAVKGATNYTVYISTKQKSGYKKVATTKKTSLVVKKYGKKTLQKKKNYYVYVVANKKVGKTTYKSDASYCWKFKMTK